VFKAAKREKVRLRMALVGPGGSGKTWTALSIATHLAELLQLPVGAGGNRVALVDTEHRSASLFADVFAFDVANMSAPYHPERYVAALQGAVADGYGIAVVDSLSHAWEGAGGVLEIVDKAGTNKFSGWKEGSPAQNRMVQAMLALPLHLVVCMRAKTEYQVDAAGRPTKVGTAPVQRAGIEYEFQMVGDVAMDHVVRLSKSRARQLERSEWPPAPAGAEHTSGHALAAALVEWLGAGAAGADEATPAQQADAAVDAPPAPQPAPQPTPAPAPAPQPAPQPVERAQVEGPAGVVDVGRLAGVVRGLLRAEPHSLSERDAWIVQLLASGESQGGAAVEVKVSTSTVRNVRKKAEESGALAAARLVWLSHTDPAATAPAGQATQEAPAQQAATIPPTQGDEAAGVPSQAQVDRITALVVELGKLRAIEGGWPAMVELRCAEWYSHPLAALTSSEADDLIERLGKTKAQLTERAQQPAA
jgi:hypothetical protein